MMKFRDGMSISGGLQDTRNLNTGHWYMWKAKLLPKEATEHCRVEDEVFKLKQENTRLKDIIVKLTARLTL